MSISEQAKAAGFSKVKTASGWIDVEIFPFRDALGWTFSEDKKAFLGPIRPATTLEIEMMEATGMRLIAYIARDKFNLQ